ncbi:MAG TPA: ribosome recycling factor [Bacteroidia bacterium]|nr:ribosome recycling factor [Bacteroidia bacterium]
MIDVNKVINDTRAHMQNAIVHLETELAKIRAGRANPSMLEGIHIDYYGANTPLSQVANVTTPDAKTIVIQAWDKNAMAPIEKAILAANLGFTPVNDGNVIRINMPTLTEERRKELVKKAKAEGEHARVTVRNIRRDGNELIKKEIKAHLPEDVAKDAEHKIQEMTDTFIKNIDKHLEAKEKEIMTV